MKPSQLPPAGTVVSSLPRALGIMRDMAHQVEANVGVDVTGHLSADVDAKGVNITHAPTAQLQCFEIMECWKKCNPPPKAGASQGRFWVAAAKPVTYRWGQWEGSSGSCSSGVDDPCEPPLPAEEDCDSSSESGGGTDLHSYWDMLDDNSTRIWWPISSPEDECDWQRALYPAYGVGQWVWCVFDYQSDVWRVIHAYDELIRFRLLEPLGRGCCEAGALAIGYPCPGSSPSGSGSGSGTPVASGGSCSAGFAQSSGAASGSSECECLEDAFRRRRIVVTDPQGIVNLLFPETCTAPVCATGWAKRCPDYEDETGGNYGRWEVISYGLDECIATSASVAGSAGSSEGSASSGSVSSGSASSASASGSSSGSSLSGSSSGSSSSGSGKSSAIVPASWSQGGYTALFVDESPQVMFHDMAVVTVADKESTIEIDHRLIEVCEAGTLEVSGCVPNIPIAVGARVRGPVVEIRLQSRPPSPARIVLRLSGVRRGFRDLRFPDRTREQFEANERFIRGAYADG